MYKLIHNTKPFIIRELISKLKTYSRARNVKIFKLKEL